MKWAGHVEHTGKVWSENPKGKKESDMDVMVILKWN
jgi:hypothetical protein